MLNDGVQDASFGKMQRRTQYEETERRILIVRYMSWGKSLVYSQLPCYIDTYLSRYVQCLWLILGPNCFNPTLTLELTLYHISTLDNSIF